jgi:hypothetical protein
MQGSGGIPALRRGSALRLDRVQQPVHVDDEIAHLGVVDRLLGGRLPSLVGLGVVRIDADDIEGIEVGELVGVDIGQLAATEAGDQYAAALRELFDLSVPTPTSDLPRAVDVVRSPPPGEDEPR